MTARKDEARGSNASRTTERADVENSAKVAKPAQDADPGLPPSGYTLGEEIANSVTHGVGVGFALVALTMLVVFAVLRGDSWGLGSAIVFGVSLVLLYAGSTLYHSIPFPRARRVLKIIDHCAIYVLIAGSYTPFTLVTLRDAGGWWMFAIVWTLAVAGISTEAFWAYRPKWVSVVVYVAMGWLVMFMIKPVIAGLAMPGLWLLVAGGIFYTAGTVFYVFKRVPYFHMVWHLFVLAGSVSHFLSVLLYVIPVRG